VWIVYPIIKLLHELGHAVATKQGGGESARGGNHAARADADSLC